MTTMPCTMNSRPTCLQLLRRALALSATAVLLLACGGGGSSNDAGTEATPPPVAAQAAAATIDAAGGELEAVLEGGTKVLLEVPPQALAEAVDFRIDPEPAASGTQGHFRIRPAGLMLRQPVTLTITLPAAAGTPDPDLTLVVVAGDERVPVSGRPDPATRTLRAVLRHLGAPSDAAGAQAADRKRALAHGRRARRPRQRKTRPSSPSWCGRATSSSSTR